MQLDQTNVAIRVRTLSEIGDLSLMMVRRYPRAFFQAFFVGALFWIVLNGFLLGWMTLDFANSVNYESSFEGETDPLFFRYLFWMATLVFLQTPIAGVFSTFSLGQSIFESQPSLQRTIRECRGLFWPVVWTLGIKRMAIPAVVVAALRWGQDFNGFYDVFLPIVFILIAALIRSNRPFVGEMILLERCPIRSPSPDVITLARRSKALHSPLSSELGGRFLSVSLVLTALLACVFYSIFWIRGIALSLWTVDTVALMIFYPLALWMIASLSVVVRLLGYLDARIRLEGWEVELAIRAEAIRQFGEDIMSMPNGAASPDRGASPNPPANSAAGSSAAGKSAAGNSVSQSGPNPGGPSPGSPSPGSPSPGSVMVTKTTVTAILFALFCWSGSSAAVAQELKPMVSDSVWFDSETNSIVPIEVADQRTDTLNRESRWTPQPSTPKKKPMPKTTTTTGGGGFWGAMTWGNFFGWILLVLLMVALIGMLAYVFANSSFDFRPAPIQQTLVQQRTLDAQTKQRIAELPAELRNTDVNPRTELERWMQSGDFDRAIIYLYGHQLLMLDRVAWLRLSRWKTNNQYVRETRGNQTPAGDLLAATVQAFERSYFGRHSLDRNQFDVLWQNNLNLEAMIAQPSEAKV